MIKTIEDFKNNIDTLDRSKGNDAVFQKAMKMLCPISQNQMQNFTNKWDGEKGFTAFVRAQNKEIKICLEMEMSQFGTDVRKQFGLKELKLDTVII